MGQNREAGLTLRMAWRRWPGLDKTGIEGNMRVKTRAVALVLVTLVSGLWVALAADQTGGYKADIETFRQKRNESLKKNWISLAGLFWLKPGGNSVGSEKNNDVVLTKAPAPVGISGEVGIEQLERNLAIEVVVPCPINRAESAAAHEP